VVGTATLTKTARSMSVPSMSDPQAEFKFFKWLYELGSFDIENPEDRIKLVHWLADIEGELLMESSVFRCISPEIDQKKYLASPSAYCSSAAKEKTRNYTLFEPSWNKDRFCMLDSILQFADANGGAVTVKVSVLARQNIMGWKLIELKRTRI
jgi:hypothetical protein